MVATPATAGSVADAGASVQSVHRDVPRFLSFHCFLLNPVLGLDCPHIEHKDFCCDGGDIIFWNNGNYAQFGVATNMRQCQNICNTKHECAGFTYNSKKKICGWSHHSGLQIGRAHV